MAWCPECKRKYNDNITRCPDCDVELVDAVTLKEELLDSIKPYEFKEDFTMQDLVDDLDGSGKRPEEAKKYKSAMERYANARSTAFSFLVIGGLGLAAMILDMAGILNMPLQGFAVYTMAGVFALFFLFGAASIIKSKKLLPAVGKEQAQINAIKKWYHTDGAHRDAMSGLDKKAADEAEEEWYLRKYRTICLLLKKQFPDADEQLLDKLAADFCEEE